MRVFTFAPRNFQAVPSFFWRDSGLLHNALVELGHDSKVVLKGPAFPDDPQTIIRGSQSDLTNPEWWRRLGCDCVIMVAWALPEDLHIVRAIRDSGVKFALHIDSSGNCFPYQNWIPTLRIIWRVERGIHQRLLSRLLFFPLRLVKWTIRFGFEYTPQFHEQMASATIVSCTTPDALNGNKSFFERGYGKDRHANFVLTGLPISDSCVWDGITVKENSIVSIGRWDSLAQKRPYSLIRISELVLKRHSSYQIDIYGNFPDYLMEAVERLDPQVRSRFHIHGIQPGSVIAHALQRSKIYLCTSSFESGPQTAYEAAACGVSFVSVDCIGVAAGLYLKQTGHADLATSDSDEAFADAVNHAINKWDSGIYDPAQMSAFWSERCHATKVAAKILSHLAE